jgi:hypothetical protein
MPKRDDILHDDEDSDYYFSEDEIVIVPGVKSYKLFSYESDTDETFSDTEYDEDGNVIFTLVDSRDLIPLVTEYNGPGFIELERPPPPTIPLIYTANFPRWGEYLDNQTEPVEIPKPEPIIQIPVTKKQPVKVWSVCEQDKSINLCSIQQEEEQAKIIPPKPPTPPSLPRNNNSNRLLSRSPKDTPKDTPKLKSLLTRQDDSKIDSRRDSRHDNRQDSRHDNRQDSRHDSRHDNRQDSRHENRHDSRHDNRQDSRQDSSRQRDSRPRLLGNKGSKIDEHANKTYTRRFDLLCYNKEGHDSACKHVHNLEQWKPKTCKFADCHKMISCPFFHETKESKVEYIKRSVNIKDSFFAKHKKEFGILYFS